jgi:hypothetical protein
MSNKKIAEIFLRVGLAFSFLYAAISGFKNPSAWIGYLPANYLPEFITANQALLVLGILQVALALWLLSGKKIGMAAIISILFFAGVLFFNWSQMPILFRDISLALSAAALFFIARARG